MILCSWLYRVCVCSIFVFPRTLPLRRSHLWWKGKYVLLNMVAMINQGVKFVLFDIIALWLVSWWSTKGKDDKMELYVVCSLICIMMIRQGVFSFLLLNIFAPWLVSWWSAKVKCQDWAIWRMLLGLYHNDQPRTNFLLLNISALWLVSRWSAKEYFVAFKHIRTLTCIMMISQSEMSRWKYVKYAPWFVSQWSTKGNFPLLNIIALWLVSRWWAKAKYQDEAIWRMLLGLYHNDQPRENFLS